MQVNGWELFAHPLLLDQLEKLLAAVEKARAKQPRTSTRAAPTSRCWPRCGN